MKRGLAKAAVAPADSGAASVETGKAVVAAMAVAEDARAAVAAADPGKRITAIQHASRVNRAGSVTR